MENIIENNSVQNKNSTNFSNLYNLGQFHESLAYDYALQIIYNVETTSSNFLASFTNQSIGQFSLAGGSLQLEYLQEKVHDGRINDMMLENNLLYSCGNDGAVKIQDQRNHQIVQTFKKYGKEFYSLSKSEQILGVGAQKGEIYFWDLNMMKFLISFEETHQDDVTSMKFFKQEALQFGAQNYSDILLKENSKWLLTGSQDGILCLFDLSQPTEEDSIYSMIRLDQPIDKVGFYNGNCKIAYAVTTISTIVIVDLEESKILYTLKVIENVNFLFMIMVLKNEFNHKYLISGKFNYLQNQFEYYFADRQANQVVKNVLLNNGEMVNTSLYPKCCAQIRNICELPENQYLISGEDSTFNIISSSVQMTNQTIENNKPNAIENNDDDDDLPFHKKKKNQKKQQFKPF